MMTSEEQPAHKLAKKKSASSFSGIKASVVKYKYTGINIVLICL